MSIPTPWPTELAFDRTARLLRLSFDEGSRFEIPFAVLRVESPSAENKGHGGVRPTAPVATKADVDVLGAEPVGRYAVRIRFDDGHDTGLYSWDLLYELGRRAKAKLSPS